MGSPIHTDNVFKFTRDQKECVICTEEYELGEDIAKLKCGHQYHKECHKKLKEKHGPKTVEQAIRMIVYEEQIKVICPLCDKLTQ